MTNDELIQLIAHEAFPCVSIVVPMHNKNPERQNDHLIVKKAIDAAKTLLKMKEGENGFDSSILSNKLDDLYHQIDFLHVKQGLGIYASSTLARLVHFPFHVHQKIAVNNKFAGMDLYYYLYSTRNYRVLHLQQHAVHLFNGKEDQLNEIMDGYFPAEYKEEYEYEKAEKITSHGSTVLKQFERDKHALQEIRIKDFYKKIDTSVRNYVAEDMPLLIAGTKNELSSFLEISKNIQYVKGKVVGDLLFKDHYELGRKCWEELQVQIGKHHDYLINELEEDFGRNLLVYGVYNVYSAAIDGKGRLLLVDKEYKNAELIYPDGIAVNNGKKRSKDKDHILMSDAFETVIRLVRDKGGEIVFVEPQKLNEWKGIALQLRYQ
jgi:hypothetical protein